VARASTTCRADTSAAIHSALGLAKIMPSRRAIAVLHARATAQRNTRGYLFTLAARLRRPHVEATDV
jgi:hypothetical protein